MNKFYLRHNQKGRSMVEMLAVIMIIGVLTVGALTGFNQTMEKYNVGKMHTDIQSISTEIANLNSWRRVYTEDAVAMSLLCANDVFPDGCVQNGEDVKAYNPFGGKYTVNLGTGSDDGLLIIKADDLPAGACEDLIIREWSYVAETPTCVPDSTAAPNIPRTFTIKFE